MLSLLTSWPVPTGATATHSHVYRSASGDGAVGGARCRVLRWARDSRGRHSAVLTVGECGIDNTIMEREITIDSAGRIVIPKEIRRRLHLPGGARLVLTEDEERLVLTPRREIGGTVEKHGILVFQGRLSEGFGDHRVDREDRLAHLAAL